MNAHRVETVISQDRRVTLEDLPIQVGELAEVIILQCVSKRREKDRYPLRSTPIKYINPTEPEAKEDWSALDDCV